MITLGPFKEEPPQKNKGPESGAWGQELGRMLVDLRGGEVRSWKKGHIVRAL